MSRACVAVPGSSATENRSDPPTARTPPSHATGRVQPIRADSLAKPASSAPSAETMSSTWTGAAACRNVPQVVATGNTGW